LPHDHSWLVINGFFQNYQYYPQNGNTKLPKNAFLALVPKIIEKGIRLNKKAIPLGLGSLYQFFCGEKVEENKLRISKERLLRDYPMLLTISNTKIRNWATAIATNKKIVNIGNKEYQLTTGAKEKLLKILSTYSNTELEEKLKVVLQG